jgi:hypothetical protein
MLMSDLVLYAAGTMLSGMKLIRDAKAVLRDHQLLSF